MRELATYSDFEPSELPSWLGLVFRASVFLALSAVIGALVATVVLLLTLGVAAIPGVSVSLPIEPIYFWTFWGYVLPAFVVGALLSWVYEFGLRAQYKAYLSNMPSNALRGALDTPDLKSLDGKLISGELEKRREHRVA